MIKKTTFIPEDYRPVPSGSLLDEHHALDDYHTLKSCLYQDDIDQQITTVCIGPKNDEVMKTIERNIVLEENIFFLILEELYTSWTFVCRDGDIKFLITDSMYGCRAIQPSLIYFRAGMCGDDSRFKQPLFDIVNLLDLWDKDLLCKPFEHRLNNSKLHQMMMSIVPAMSSVVECPVSIADCFVVKGHDSYHRLNHEKLVTKSLSGIRSEVVDQTVYSSWNQESIQYIPTLFQKMVDGVDIRIHSINGKFYAKRIDKNISACCSLRYQTTEEKLSDYPISKGLIEFSQALLKIENLSLAGIDVMLEENGNYICFEVNPGPGWSAFHKHEDVSGENFLHEMMNCLKSGKINESI